MVAKKRKSKRQSLQQKYKIIKRTKEHHKKLKKGVAVGHNAKKKQKDHIPNAWPYKEQLLQEIQAAKERMEENKLRQKEKRQEEIRKRRLGDSGTGSMDVEKADTSNPNSSVIEHNTYQESADDAAAEADSGDNEENNLNKLGQQSRRAYLKELKKVVERSDVILQVLDARDPNGTKSTAVEDMILKHHRKRLVYVLNKADLVPKDVLVGWLQLLRQSHPTVPFKCNTQQQKGNLGSSTGKVVKHQENSLKANHTVGAEELLNILKNYCRIGDGKTGSNSGSSSSSSVKSIITVGIVGFPNVGKSSLVNSLLRTRSVGVSSVPGFTKASQEVILDRNIRLIDSPGIVFADGNGTATALRNCVNVEELIDVYTPVQAILDKCPQQYLMQLYSIPKFKSKDTMSFLALVGKAMGKLKKGGIPNTDAAARTVLHDWNDGKIKFFCRPPRSDLSKTNKRSSSNTSGNTTRSSSSSSSSSDKDTNGIEADSKVLNSFSEQFDIDKLQQGDDVKVLRELYHADGDSGDISGSSSNKNNNNNNNGGEGVSGGSSGSAAGLGGDVFVGLDSVAESIEKAMPMDE